MHIGIPKEIKPLEGRVALVPSAVAELVGAGHEVFLQSGAGLASGYADTDYARIGVKIETDAASLYGRAQMVLKVKEPVEQEYELLQENHILFSYLHLAANPKLARLLQKRGLLAVGFETVVENGQLPLLAPMSDIAGRLSVQIGATLLHAHHGGRGLLLGGMPAGERGHVVVLGAGSAGGNAAAVAAALGAQVTVFAHSRVSLARMHALSANVTALPSYKPMLEEAARSADLLIGAVLIPGARTPRLVTEEMVQAMRPGSVIVDISVDQGGCIATTRPTDYTQPTFVKHGVVHFGVTNMPGAVPRTASQALSASLVPHVLRLAADGGSEDPVICSGINVRAGEIVHAAVARAINQAT